jgi:hypothetical protein
LAGSNLQPNIRTLVLRGMSTGDRMPAVLRGGQLLGDEVVTKLRIDELRTMALEVPSTEKSNSQLPSPNIAFARRGKRSQGLSSALRGHADMRDPDLLPAMLSGPQTCRTHS